MCLIAFAWNVHRDLPLIVAANRDEFHARPTAALAEWSDEAGVFGGRDLKEGGSWMALAPARRRMAAVTNVRQTPMREAPRSRGALVRGFVTGEADATQYAVQRAIDGDEYGPFNLLLWDGLELIYASNRPKPHWAPVAPGVHGLSNAELDTPWPKTRRLSAALRGWVADLPATGAVPALEQIDAQPLFDALADASNAADRDLPDTGIGLDMERRLSPPFIRGPVYGTRVSTVLLIAGDGRAWFAERRFAADGVPAGYSQLSLSARA